MKAKLICQACGTPLSEALEVQSLADPETAGLAFIDGEPLTPAGTVFQSAVPMQWSSEANMHVPLQFTPQFWLNPIDVEASVEMVEDFRKLNGCCGLDGTNGPNMRCRACKTEVGTRQSDCWTSDVFIPQPGATEWSEVDQ